MRQPQDTTITPAWAAQANRDDRRCGVPDHDDHERRPGLRALGTLYVLARILLLAWVAAMPPVALVLLAIMCLPALAFEAFEVILGLWLLVKRVRIPEYT